MGKITQYSRISHHTIVGEELSGASFSVPESEDFTDGTWTIYDLALSEIAVNEYQGTAFIRIDNEIKQFQFTSDAPGIDTLSDVLINGNASGTRNIELTAGTGLINSGSASFYLNNPVNSNEEIKISIFDNPNNLGSIISMTPSYINLIVEDDADVTRVDISNGQVNFKINGFNEIEIDSNGLTVNGLTSSTTRLVSADSNGLLVLGTDIREISVTISSTDILALATTNYNLIPAITGKIIQPISIMMRMDYNSITYTGDTTVLISCNETVDDYLWSSDILSSGVSVIRSASEDGTGPLKVSNTIALYSNSAPLSGNSDLIVNILYRVI